MTRVRNSKKFIEKILSLMSDDEPYQAKDLLELACTRSDKNKDPMGTNQLYFSLNLMNGTYINKFKLEDDQRAVYYIKCKSLKMVRTTEQIIGEITPTLKELVKTVNESIGVELAYIKKLENLSKKEEIAIFREIGQDKDQIGRVIGSALLKQAFKIIKASEPVLTNKDFYIDSEGNTMPKALVDERISQDDRMKWLYGDNWRKQEQCEKELEDWAIKDKEKEIKDKIANHFSNG